MDRQKHQKHGASMTPTWQSWIHMKHRCLNPQCHAYPDYGGRGITVCERWMEYKNFLADMGERPSLQHTVDRIDNSGNYDIGNCRWATKKEQIENRRSFNQWRERKGVVKITIGDRTQCMKDWCRELGIPYGRVNARVNRLGWPVMKALGL